MTWDLGELQQHFALLGIHGPFVVVKRYSDGQVGTVEFASRPCTIPPRGERVTSPPRFFDWQPYEDTSERP